MNAEKKRIHGFFFFMPIVCALFSVISCSQSTGAARDFSSEETLRAAVSDFAASVQWTLNGAQDNPSQDRADEAGLSDGDQHAQGENRALPDDRAPSDAYEPANAYTFAQVRLPSGSSQNAESLFVSLLSLSLEKPVYPLLEGFTVLNSSELPNAARPLLNRVLEGCKSKKLDEAFFAPGLHFLKTVAEYELQSLPDADSWIVGFAQKLDGSVYEVSARFFGACGFFDAHVYIVREEDGSYKVEQLFFGKAEK